MYQVAQANGLTDLVAALDEDNLQRESSLTHAVSCVELLLFLLSLTSSTACLHPQQGCFQAGC